jgi:phosphoglycolate phosphatase
MANIVAQARRNAERQEVLLPDIFQRRVDEFFDEFETAALSNVRLRDDAMKVLASLREAGVELGIVSNSGRKAVNAVLERLGLLRYFRAVVTRDDAKSLKPSGEGVVKALQILRCERKRAAYLGDSWIDVRAARDAGVMAIALTGGLSSAERLRNEGPDAVVESLSELLGVLKGNGAP